MAKIYTAQEMREMADKLESRKEYAICCFDAIDNEWRPVWQNPDPIILALRQAAAALEHDEKYETSIRYAGKGRYATFVRKVSEWKEAK